MRIVCAGLVDLQIAALGGQNRERRSPVEVERFAHKHDWIVGRIIEKAVNHIERHARRLRKRNRQLFHLPAAGALQNVQRRKMAHVGHVLPRRGVVALRRGHGFDIARHLRDDGADRLGGARLSLLHQSRAHVLGCTGEQAAKHRR